MDKRIIFVIVFFFTLISTMLVAGVCVLTKQTVMVTVLYSLTTMWVIGIISQLLLQSLYQAVVTPIAEKREGVEEEEATMPEINLKEIEEIEEVTQKIQEHQTIVKPQQETLSATAGKNDE